jgi:hypothetical protein
MKLGTEGIFLMIGLALLVLVTTVAATSTPQDPGPGLQRAPEPGKRTWVRGTSRSVRLNPVFGEWPILD